MLNINVEIQPIVAAGMERLYDRYVVVMIGSGRPSMNFSDFWNQIIVRGEIAYIKQLEPLESELNITEGVPE